MSVPRCKAIAAAHGGALSVESVVGQGTAATATLQADLPGPVQGEEKLGFAASLSARTSGGTA